MDRLDLDVKEAPLGNAPQVIIDLNEASGTEAFDGPQDQACHRVRDQRSGRERDRDRGRDTDELGSPSSAATVAVAVRRIIVSWRVTFVTPA